MLQSMKLLFSQWWDYKLYFINQDDESFGMKLQCLCHGGWIAMVATSGRRRQQTMVDGFYGDDKLQALSSSSSSLQVFSWIFF